MEIPSQDLLLERFNVWDYLVFVGMVALSGVIGLYYAFKGGAFNSIRTLLTGDGQMPVLPTATSLLASYISAAYILGNASEMYMYGTMLYYTLLSYLVAIPFSAATFVPVFFNSKVTTAYEYIGRRYNRTICVIAVIMYTIQMCVYIAVCLYAPALALSQVTGMGLWVCVVVLGIVCTIYTSIGGIKAVIYTDTFQTIVMIVSMITVLGLGFDAMGGIKHVFQVAHDHGRIIFDEFSADPTHRHTMWGMFIGMLFTNLSTYATNQMMVVRYATQASVTKAKTIVWLQIPYLALMLTLSCLAGLMMFSRYYDCDPIKIGQINTTDQILPYFVMDVLGDKVCIAGLFVAGIFAASLSCISSAVNALASVFYVDVVNKWKPELSPTAGARVINVLGVFFGLLSIALVAIVEKMGNVLDASNCINSALGGPLLGLFAMAMFVPHSNSKGALAGLIVALAFALWINVGNFVNGPTYPELPIGVADCQEYYNNLNLTSVSNSTDEAKNVFDLYKISSDWYTMLSAIIVFIIGIPVSCCTGWSDVDVMDPKLISSFVDVVFWFLPESILSQIRFNVGSLYKEERQPADDDIFRAVDEKGGVYNVSYVSSQVDLSGANGHHATTNGDTKPQSFAVYQERRSSAGTTPNRYRF